MTTNLSKKDRLSQIRVFIAIELPEDLRAGLGSLQSQFGAAADAAKWVAPDLLHVTVRFLGGIDPDRLPAVESAARETASAFDPFSLDVGRPGAFPNERNPQVLWVGLEGDAGLSALERLHGVLERSLDERGFGCEDKPFVPHISVARATERARPEGRRALGTALANVRSRPGGARRSFPVQSLTVMRSDLGPGGPRYTPLVRVPLRFAGSTGEAATPERLAEQ
jgi:2'-5' RNA ligase